MTSDKPSADHLVKCLLLPGARLRLEPVYLFVRKSPPHPKEKSTWCYCEKNQPLNICLYHQSLISNILLLPHYMSLPFYHQCTIVRETQPPHVQLFDSFPLSISPRILSLPHCVSLLLFLQCTVVRDCQLPPLALSSATAPVPSLARSATWSVIRAIPSADHRPAHAS